MKTIEELRNDIVEPNYIIENMIRENGLYCLLGEAKVGKSAMAIQIANSVANGIPFLNFKTSKSPVLYLSTEMNPNETISRIDLMKCNLNNYNFFYTFPEDNFSQLNIFTVENEIKKFSEYYNGKLVFIDMFNGINFGKIYDLNNYQDMSQNVFPIIRNLCNKYNVTIVIVHHLNRKGKSLGSTAIDTCIDGKISLKQDNNIKSCFYFQYESRDYPRLDYVLKRDESLVLSIDETTEDVLNENLMQLLKYAIRHKEFTFTSSEMVSKLNLSIIPSVLGKLIINNKKKLEKLGLYLECKRSASERLWNASYKEPLDDYLYETNNLKSKEDFYGS